MILPLFTSIIAAINQMLTFVKRGKNLRNSDLDDDEAELITFSSALAHVLIVEVIMTKRS